MYSQAITEPWYQDAVINNIPMPTRRGGRDSSEYRWNLFIKPFMAKGDKERRLLSLEAMLVFISEKQEN